MNGSTVIANLALSHLGIGMAIANLDTERSAEAMALRRFYATTLEEVLRAFAWPFATRIEALALVEEDPNSEWGFSYRYPTECLSLRRILSGSRNDTRQSLVPYRVAQDDQGRLVFTDQSEAEAEYTFLETVPSKYPPDFRMAFSLLLASYVAPRIAGADPFSRGDKALNRYHLVMAEAMQNSANEEQSDEPPESEFVRARE